MGLYNARYARYRAAGNAGFSRPQPA